MEGHIMVASPVLMQAEGALRPGFQALVNAGQFGGGVEFCLASIFDDKTGQKRYQAAAQLLFIGGQQGDEQESIPFLQKAFNQAKAEGKIPPEAIFGVSESIERQKTYRWALAILPSCGDFVATPTICD